MKKYNLILGLLSFAIVGCVSIPKETITLSQILGNDLKILHNSHRNMVEIYYDKIEEDINAFIDGVYAPFIIHYVLKIELDKFKKGDASLYGAIKAAGKTSAITETSEALLVMQEFQQAVNFQINEKRKELLDPIAKQEKEILTSINVSYENAIYANSTITGHLESIRKVKESQQEALSIIGLKGADSLITNTLINVSEQVNKVIDTAKKIDKGSDEAFNQMEDALKKIKELTNKN